MKRAPLKILLRLYVSSNLFPASPISRSPVTRFFPGFIPFSSKPERDSILLEKFRQRKLKGSSTTSEIRSPPIHSLEEKGNCGLKNGDDGSTQVVSKFEQLGLKKEVIDGVEEMGVFVPSEIQCVGIPAVLEGKSLVLSSFAGSGRTLAYLLPLVQLLREEEAKSGVKPDHPRAIVICNSEQLSDQVFQVAKFISQSTQLKSVKDTRGKEDSSNVSIGMVIGTPNEILQYFDEGDIAADDIKYMVLDEADAMLNRGLGPEIQKVLSQIRNNKMDHINMGFQTIMVTSTIAAILGKKFSSFVEHFERDHAGKVAAMLLEMEPLEVFQIVESPDALRKRVAEAMESLDSSSS